MERDEWQDPPGICFGDGGCWMHSRLFCDLRSVGASPYGRRRTELKEVRKKWKANRLRKDAVKVGLMAVAFGAQR